MKSVCLAILNYNGKQHLEHLLPTACAAAKNVRGTCTVVVLDNQSTRDDVAWIEREFPSVHATSSRVLWLSRTTTVDRKSTRLNSSHLGTSYAVFCLKKKKQIAT